MKTRPKIASLFVIITASILTPLEASIIAYDGMNYTPGSDLSTQTQPAQFGGWKGGASPGITSSAGSLSYTNGATLDTTGNKVSGGNWQSTGEGMNFSSSAWDLYKVTPLNFYSNPSNRIGQGTLYVSALVQAGSGQEAHFGLYTGDTNADAFGQLAIGAAINVSGGGAVTLRMASYNPSSITFDQVAQNGTTGATHTVQNSGSLSVTAGVTNLYVFKFVFGTTDTVSLYLNPTVGGTEPGSVSASLTTPAGEKLIFSSFATFLGYNSNSNFIDEVRFGSTWADVTPAIAAIPEPSTFAFLIGAFGLVAASTRRRRAA